MPVGFFQVIKNMNPDRQYNCLALFVFINAQVRLSIHSEKAPTQKLLFLNNGPGRYVRCIFSLLLTLNQYRKKRAYTLQKDLQKKLITGDFNPIDK